MGLPLARCLQATLHTGCKPACMVSASYLARCLQATLHGGCKLPCTVSASLLARWLQACLRASLKPALSVSHWEGCLPRGGEGVSLEAGRVLPPRRGGCLPRGGRVLPPRRGGCLPRGGKGVFPEAGKGISHVELILGYRHTEIIRCPIDSPKHDPSKTKPLHPGNGQGGFRTDASTHTMRGRRGEGDQSWW